MDLCSLAQDFLKQGFPQNRRHAQSTLAECGGPRGVATQEQPVSEPRTETTHPKILPRAATKRLGWKYYGKGNPLYDVRGTYS